MNEYQLSLVFFTILCQLSVGGVMAVTLYRSLKEFDDQKWNGKTVAALIWTICLVGSFCLFGHLGSPKMVYKALGASGHCWLSREVVVFVTLNGLMAMWMVSHYAEARKQTQQMLGAVTSVVGLVAILVSAQVYYQQSTHPQWNTLLIHMAFLSSVMVLGIALVVVFIRAYDLRVPWVMRCLLGFSVMFKFVVVTLFARHMDSYASHNLLTVYQLVGSVLGGTLLFVMVRDTHRYKPEWVLLATMVVVSGELAGRSSFFGALTNPILC